MILTTRIAFLFSIIKNRTNPWKMQYLHLTLTHLKGRTPMPGSSISSGFIPSYHNSWWRSWGCWMWTLVPASWSSTSWRRGSRQSGLAATHQNPPRGAQAHPRSASWVPCKSMHTVRSNTNHINVNKTLEMVVDFRRAPNAADHRWCHCGEDQ